MSDLINLSIAFRETINNIKSLADNPQLKALPLPSNKLQSYMHGLRLGETTLLGGFEGHGKSTIAQMIALSLAELFSYDTEGKRGVLYCSLEMYYPLLIQRLITQSTGIPMVKLQEPENLSQFDWEKITDLQSKIDFWPLIIDDSATLDTRDIRSIINDAKAEMDIKLVIVDYLQLLTDSSLNGEVARLDGIIKNLKDISRLYTCHVLAISSLNRSMMNENGTPTSRNIRGSGGLSYNTDNILLLHRPHLYNSSQYEEWRDYAEIIISKQRNGPTGTIFMKWDAKNLVFRDMSREEEKSLTKGDINNVF